jgi:mono/diheme cytochrome c family protein
VRRAALAGALAALVLGPAGCGSGAHVEAGAGNRTNGKELFSAKCGGCHTLADAGTQGPVGPNLDEAFKYSRSETANKEGFEESTIRDVVRGQIAYPVVDPSTGAPGMPAIDETLPECSSENEPAGCVDDQEQAADDIATYVAAVAGLPVSGGGNEQPGGGTDGKSIFASAGCNGCHTLAAAGASGTIGPNLDEAKPSVDVAIERVTNGKGAMPSFRDRLSKPQIDAVAKFVAENAGK